MPVRALLLVVFFILFTCCLGLEVRFKRSPRLAHHDYKSHDIGQELGPPADDDDDDELESGGVEDVSKAKGSESSEENEAEEHHSIVTSTTPAQLHRDPMDRMRNRKQMHKEQQSVESQRRARILKEKENGDDSASNHQSDSSNVDLHDHGSQYSQYETTRPPNGNHRPRLREYTHFRKQLANHELNYEQQLVLTRYYTNSDNSMIVVGILIFVISGTGISLFICWHRAKQGHY